MDVAVLLQQSLKKDVINDLALKLLFGQSFSVRREMQSILDDKLSKITNRIDKKGDDGIDTYYEALSLQRELYCDDESMSGNQFVRKYVNELIPEKWIVLSVNFDTSRDRLIFGRLERNQVLYGSQKKAHCY